MDDIGGIGLYMNTLIISIAETLSYTTTDFFIPKLKRKKTIIIGLGVGFVMSLSYLFINSSKGFAGQKVI